MSRAPSCCFTRCLYADNAVQKMVACRLSSLYNPGVQVLAAHGAIYNPEESRTAAAPAVPAAVEPVGQAAAAQPAVQAQLRAAVQPTGEPVSEQPAAALAAPGELCLTIRTGRDGACDSLVHHSA